MDDIFPKNGPRPSLPSGGDRILLWLAIGAAVVLFTFFLIDHVRHWRRQRAFQKRVEESRAKNKTDKAT